MILVSGASFIYTSYILADKKVLSEDWSSPALALTPVNGHVQSRWSQKTGEWSEPEFVEDPFLRVHGLATAFHYGEWL